MISLKRKKKLKVVGAKIGLARAGLGDNMMITEYPKTGFYGVLNWKPHNLPEIDKV